MDTRDIKESTLIEIIESGKVKQKGGKKKFWVYKSFPKRNNNSICASVTIEAPNLIVITTLINWRPNDKD